MGTRIKKGDSLEEVPQHSAAALNNPILSNPTGEVAGMQIQIPLTAIEPQRKMSPNPRVLGPVKFAKAQEVELLWLETIKVRFSAPNFLFFLVFKFFMVCVFFCHSFLIFCMTRIRITSCNNQSTPYPFLSTTFKTFFTQINRKISSSSSDITDTLPLLCFCNTSLPLLHSPGLCGCEQ